MSSKAKLIDKIGQFTTVPNSVIKLWPEIGLDAFALFVCLRYHSNEKDECFPAYDTIEKETGLNRHRISAAVKVLEEHGLLKRRKRFSQSTVYILTLPISADITLMDDETSVPEVQNLHYSSADNALPVVQDLHPNQTHLTRLKEPEEEAAPPAFDTTDIPALICEATGMVTIPPAEMARVEQIRALVCAYTPPKVVDAMRQAFTDWTSRSRKDGGRYRATNFGWVDWAQDILLGNNAPSGTSAAIMRNADGSINV